MPLSQTTWVGVVPLWITHPKSLVVPKSPLPWDGETATPRLKI